MKKLFLAAVIVAAPLFALNLTGVAAGTTIAVNALEIRSTTAKAIKALKATRKAAVKAAKKVAGKK